MKKLIQIFLVFILISCDKPKENISIKEGFITKEGTYYAKNIKIVVKKLDDDSLIYAICDRFNKILYQSNLMTPFSKYHFWMMYIDINENVWVYDSDYDNKKIIMKNDSNKYIENDYCKMNIAKPKKIRDKLKELNIKDCGNLKN